MLDIDKKEIAIEILWNAVILHWLFFQLTICLIAYYTN